MFRRDAKRGRELRAAWDLQWWVATSGLDLSQGQVSATEALSVPEVSGFADPG